MPETCHGVALHSEMMVVLLFSRLVGNDVKIKLATSLIFVDLSEKLFFIGSRNRVKICKINLRVICF